MSSTRQVRVGDILQLCREPVEIDPFQGYVAIGIRSFGKGMIIYPSRPGNELSKLRYFRFPGNSLAISNIKAWEGAIAMAEAPIDAVASNRFLFYRPIDDSVDIRYIKYYFLTELGLAQIGKASPGSADRNRTLSIQSFENIRIDLPDIHEQRRIAARLDIISENTARLERLRQQQADTCAALSESIIRSVVSDASNRVPIGMVLSPSRVAMEINPDRYYRTFGLRSFGRGSIHYDRTLGSELSKLRYFNFPAQALALSNIKAWEGAVGVTSEFDTECVASNRFLFYSPTGDDINISFIRHYLLSQEGIALIGKCSPGMADRNRTLNIRAFERVPIPLLPRHKQDEVAFILDELKLRVLKAHADDQHLRALVPSVLNSSYK